MAYQFILPDIGEGVVEGEIVRWHVKAGDTVKEDQTLVEIMTDKATVQIPSPKAGKVGKLFYKEGDVAKVGKAIIEIETGGSEASAPVAQAAPQPSAHTVASAAPAPQARAAEPSRPAFEAAASAQPQQAVAQGSSALVASTGEREILATPAVRKLARDEGVELAKIQGTGPFGRITREDVLRHAQGGQVISFTPPPQQKTQQTQTEAPVRENAQARTQEPRREDRGDNRGNQRDFSRDDVQPQQQSFQQPRRDERQEQPPRREENRPAAQQQQPAPQAQQAPRAAGAETRVPIRGLRKRISEKMHQSKSTAAHFTYVEEFDLTELVKLREQVNAKLAPQKVKLNYLPFILKACVIALRKFPTINALVDDQRGEYVMKTDINIGIAVQTDDGLMVPVIRNVEQKSMVALQREIETLSDKVKKRQATQQELTGGSFTITSLGAVGGMLATPVINYPEVAILGVHAIKKKPAVVNNEIVIRDLGNFSSSFDHRLIDGYIGAQFLAEIKRLLEDPQTLFLEL
jgi:pyruvate dehydrogenase E2 component (dihydrolipoamide acetyltransferase)